MFARTPRLTLRPGWAEDAAALTTAIAHEAVVANLAQAPWPYRLSDAQRFLAQPVPAGGVRCLVFDDPSGTPRLVGGVAIERGGDVPEFGYWFTPDAWGRGYASEAGAAVVAIARDTLRLRRLVATPARDNPASARVLAKLGFTPAGRGEHWFAARGRMVACDRFERELGASVGLSIAA